MMSLGSSDIIILVISCRLIQFASMRVCTVIACNLQPLVYLPFYPPPLRFALSASPRHRLLLAILQFPTVIHIPSPPPFLSPVSILCVSPSPAPHPSLCLSPPPIPPPDHPHTTTSHPPRVISLILLINSLLPRQLNSRRRKSLA